MKMFNKKSAPMLMIALAFASLVLFTGCRKVLVPFEATVTITPASNEILINPRDGFLIANNRDISITTNGRFVSSPQIGIKLTAEDKGNVAITTLDVELGVTRVNDSKLTAKIKATSAKGTTAHPAGSKFKITVEGQALTDATGYTPQSIELTLSAGTIWSARFGHTSVIDNEGNIFVMGGFDDVYKVKDVWKSADKGLTWELVTANPGWSARSGLRSVVDSDNVIYVLGGHDGKNKLNDVWKSVSGGATWTDLKVMATSDLTPRSYHTAVINKTTNNIYVIGGLTRDSPNDVVKSVDHGVTWNKITDGMKPWETRIHHTSVIDNQNNIYIIAGSGTNLENLSDVWKSNPEVTTWTNLGATGLSGRSGHSSVIDKNNNIYVFGGLRFVGAVSKVYLNDILKSSDGTTWKEQVPSASWSARETHSTVIDAEGNFYLLGGLNFDGSNLNDVWKSTDKGITWVRLW